MPIGAGKYDAECTAARLSSRARATIVIVIDGDRGSGFSMQADENVPVEAIAATLDHVALEMRRSVKPQGTA